MIVRLPVAFAVRPVTRPGVRPWRRMHARFSLARWRLMCLRAWARLADESRRAARISRLAWRATRERQLRNAAFLVLSAASAASGPGAAGMAGFAGTGFGYVVVPPPPPPPPVEHMAAPLPGTPRSTGPTVSG